MRVIALFLLTLMFTLSANAQVYRWVDDQGRVHYSDTPPPSEQAEALDIESGERAPAADDAADDEENETKEAPTPAAQTLADKRCELAKITLVSYRSADSLLKTDEEGNEQTLSDEEKAAAIKQAEANVAARCNTDG